MDSVSELDVLLSQALVVAENKENKNEMKNISQLPFIFIYPGDSKFIYQVWKKEIKNAVFYFFLGI